MKRRTTQRKASIRISAENQGKTGIGDASPDIAEELPQGRRAIPGSVAFVPPVAGLILAGEVVRDLTGCR